MQATESAANFATWQTESSLDLSPYQIENAVLADDASDDYLPVPAGDGGADGETADQVRQNDLATLFPGADQGTIRITRMRADLAHAALATDLTLQAASDQGDLSNFYQVTQFVNPPTCPPVQNPCPPCEGESSGGDDAGVVGSLGGGSTSRASGPGEQSFGCSAVGSDRGGIWLELSLAGILGVSVLRARSKKRK